MRAQSGLSVLTGTVIPFLPFVHIILLPTFAFRKLLNVGKPPPEEPPTAMDPDAKTVVFAFKLACVDKVIAMTFGVLLYIISTVISILKYAQIDLSSAWFPEPFWKFYNAKLALRAYQIDGAKMRFDARQEDAYLKFQYEAVMNFWTLGFFGMCCGKKTNYDRWLDTKIRWRGAPPPGFNQQFRVFFTKLRCVQKLKKALVLFMLNICGGAAAKIPLVGPLIPVAPIGMYADVFVYRMLLSNYLFGGSQPYFDKEFTWCNYVYHYYVTAILGMCGMKLKRWVDKQIRMGEAKHDPEHDADAPEDEPAVDAAPSAAPPKNAAGSAASVSATSTPVAQPAPPVADFVGVAAVASQPAAAAPSSSTWFSA